MSKTLTIQITRDSVSAGDDIHAPHTMTLRARPDDTLAVVVSRLYDRYIPRVAGSGHFWVAKTAGQTIAHSEGNANTPHFTGFAERRLEDLKKEATLAIHLTYHPASW
ncbi:hypothetical protein [Ponticaulis sp.]|uniref:hypothetical protein n=1 Tax=Ponticaulis sp. TaxID=2020902 RepID=UPI000B6B50C0|nr:hypothetical protein [Ponticaulis sp.]MAI89271.1 hypothetical protein [Ponticaulis sp.]OUY01260.1 MAG: hypothetical protein CBB65_02150 [Hyphomonadaceae bacterium TMED5]|tara:strand:+ start:4451 stop:4774 length:324 start_codon:yes stop_codon:yes gene_type:complete